MEDIAGWEDLTWMRLLSAIGISVRGADFDDWGKRTNDQDVPVNLEAALIMKKVRDFLS